MKDKTLVILPTDTVYGLAAKLYDQAALNLIYQIKGRDLNKQIPVLCSNLEQAKKIGLFSNAALKLAKCFWPGALTIVLKSTEEHFKITGEKTIAIRIPDHKETLNFIQKNGPLRTTSLNHSGEPPLFDEKTIEERYRKFVDQIFLQAESSFSHQASTVVDASNNNVKIIRLGHLKEVDLLLCINN